MTIAIKISDHRIEEFLKSDSGKFISENATRIIYFFCILRPTGGITKTNKYSFMMKKKNQIGIEVGVIK